MPMQDLYEHDFFEWTRHNAELLRRGCFTEADIPHIAEEIADMGSRDQREVRSLLQELIMHLLKWKFQPALRHNPSGGSSWLTSINKQRSELEGIFEQSPSLIRHGREAVARVYTRAVRGASAETGIPKRNFPKECPFTFDQLMDADFLPDDPA